MSIEHWNFFAFRQPCQEDKMGSISLTVSGHTLDPKKIMFLPIVEDDKLYIQIFTIDINEETKNQIAYGCLMLLDNLIGEYDCVKKVNGYEYYNISAAEEFVDELRPLTEIREFLDMYYQSKI